MAGADEECRRAQPSDTDITMTSVDPDEPLVYVDLDSTAMIELEAELQDLTGDSQLRVLAFLRHKTLREAVASLKQPQLHGIGVEHS